MPGHIVALSFIAILSALAFLFLVCANVARIYQSSVTPVQKFFRDLLSHTFNDHIDIIVWDLDGTLGDAPGWDGITPLQTYIHEIDQLARVLADTHASHGIRHILVSKNSMFCGSEYARTADQFLTLGFHQVFHCSREVGMHISKIHGLSTAPNRIILIDDQAIEVTKVVEMGGNAIHVSAPWFTAIERGQYRVYGNGLS